MSAIPEGYSTITPSLTLNGAGKAIELYQKAFGAKLLSRMDMSGTDKVVHACLQIGSSKIFLSDVHPQMCPTASNSAFYLYFDDVDAAFKKAKSAGLEEKYPLTDMFWGDRTGNVKDSFGINWTLAQHVREVSPAEMEKAGKEWFSKMKSKAA